jgi:hypothetical protein
VAKAWDLFDPGPVGRRALNSAEFQKLFSFEGGRRNIGNPPGGADAKQGQQHGPTSCHLIRHAW